MLAAFEDLNARIEIAFDRIRFDVGENPVSHTGFIQNSERGRHHWKFCQTGVSHKERILNASGLEDGRQFLDAAWAKKHGGGEIPFGSQSGHVDCFPEIQFRSDFLTQVEGFRSREVAVADG